MHSNNSNDTQLMKNSSKTRTRKQFSSTEIAKVEILLKIGQKMVPCQKSPLLGNGYEVEDASFYLWNKLHEKGKGLILWKSQNLNKIWLKLDVYQQISAKQDSPTKID